MTDALAEYATLFDEVPGLRPWHNKRPEYTLKLRTAYGIQPWWVWGRLDKRNPTDTELGPQEALAVCRMAVVERLVQHGWSLANWGGGFRIIESDAATHILPKIDEQYDMDSVLVAAARKMFE